MRGRGRRGRVVPRVALVACVLMVLMASPARAQEGIRFGVVGGTIVFFGEEPTNAEFNIPGLAPPSAEEEPRASLRTSPALGLSLGARAGRRLGFDFTVLFAPTEVPGPRGGGNGVRVGTYTAHVLLYLPVGGPRLEPFASLGGGVRGYDHGGVAVDYLTWAPGAGLAFRVAQSVALRFELRNYRTAADASDFEPGVDPLPSHPRPQSDLAALVGVSFLASPRDEGES